MSTETEWGAQTSTSTWQYQGGVPLLLTRGFMFDPVKALDEVGVIDWMSVYSVLRQNWHPWIFSNDFSSFDEKL